MTRNFCKLENHSFPGFSVSPPRLSNCIAVEPHGPSHHHDRVATDITCVFIPNTRNSSGLSGHDETPKCGAPPCQNPCHPS